MRKNEIYAHTQHGIRKYRSLHRASFERDASRAKRFTHPPVLDNNRRRYNIQMAAPVKTTLLRSGLTAGLHP